MLLLNIWPNSIALVTTSNHLFTKRATNALAGRKPRHVLRATSENILTILLGNRGRRI